MPRSEGITTFQDQAATRGPARPRKCPDQRGLRREGQTIRRKMFCGPRKCPDQRGLRLILDGDRGRFNVSEEMPRSEGITTTLYSSPSVTARMNHVRGNAPIRGDYDQKFL